MQISNWRWLLQAFFWKLTHYHFCKLELRVQLLGQLVFAPSSWCCLPFEEGNDHVIDNHVVV